MLLFIVIMFYVIWIFGLLILYAIDSWNNSEKKDTDKKPIDWKTYFIESLLISIVSCAFLIFFIKMSRFPSNKYPLIKNPGDSSVSVPSRFGVSEL